MQIDVGFAFILLLSTNQKKSQRGVLKVDKLLEVVLNQFYME